MSTQTIEKTDNKTRTCPMYKVIMHNDDVTTIQFVAGILIQIFGKDVQQALLTTLEIHETGSGLAGIYAMEHAELKVEQTHSLARTQGFPLTCTIEPA